MYAGSVGLSSFRTTSRLPLHSASVVAIPGVHDIPCLNNRAKHMGISWLCRSSPALSNCKVGHAQIWLGRELYCRMASTASCGSNSEQLYRASTLSGISYLPLLTPLFGISCRLGRSFSRYLWYVAIADADGLPCREGGCSSGPREDLSVRALQIAQFSAISGIMRMSGSPQPPPRAPSSQPIGKIPNIRTITNPRVPAALRSSYKLPAFPERPHPFGIPVSFTSSVYIHLRLASVPSTMSSSLSASSPAPSKILIPDLVSHCTIPVRLNPNWKLASVESKQWLFRGGDLSERKRDAFHGLKAGYLTSMCYPLAGYPQLRVCCDFMNYLFHLDNISDEMDHRGTLGTAINVMDPLYHPESSRPTTRVGKMTKDYWRRLIQTASPGAQQRFIETFDMFFQAITEQARDRANGLIPDLESYIAIRRDTSGCKPCWALIEYANNLDLPWEVMDHPIVRGLGEAANDLVTWSNDIFSFNVEQSKGDTHNMIIVVQKQQGLDLQSAVDFVGDLCKHSIDRFHFLRENLPSWGPEIDRDLAIYVDGLADWITGSLKWSFESERYFGKEGLEVKSTRVVTLFPRRA